MMIFENTWEFFRDIEALNISHPCLRLPQTFSQLPCWPVHTSKDDVHIFLLLTKKKWSPLNIVYTQNNFLIWVKNQQQKGTHDVLNMPCWKLCGPGTIHVLLAVSKGPLSLENPKWRPSSDSHSESVILCIDFLIDWRISKLSSYCETSTSTLLYAWLSSNRNPKALRQLNL